MSEMTGTRVVFTSRVRAWAPAAGASIVAVAIMGAVFAATGALATVAGVLSLVIAVVVVMLSGAHLATARLAITPEGIGLGLGGRPLRLMPSDEVADWDVTRVSWPQVFGVGLPLRLRTTRCLVRSGPALRVDLRSGERLWVSLSDEVGAQRLLCQTLANTKNEDHDNE